MRPSCSGMVLALTTVPGILESFLIIQLKTIFPRSRFTRKLQQIQNTNSFSSFRSLNTDRNQHETIKDSLKLYLMGTMLENSSKKRKIWRYQSPAKCCRATMTSDNTTRATNKILVRQFTSRSNKPTCQEQERKLQ